MKRSIILVWVVALLTMAAAPTHAESCADSDVDCWLVQLDTGDGAAAMRAAMTLGELGDAKAIDPLIAKFAAEDQYMATAATHAVIKIGNGAVFPLVKASTESKSAAVRKYAAYALGRIGGDDAFAAVLQAAKDEAPKVRAQAATAFGVMGDDRALLPLFELLRDRSVSVRAAAAQSLGAIGDRRATNFLLEYGLCDISPEVARASAGALVQIGPEAVEPLIDAYNTKPDYARKRIVLAVGNIGVDAPPATRGRAVKLASWVLKRKTEGVETRAVAAYVLGTLDAKDAVPVLKQALAESGAKEEQKTLHASCEQALLKIYQKYEMKRDF
ncbi:MAG: HEAT repeat domain-containing protein [Candidatus Lernaella stagnicola]|nr:HEAT repeat domain-containing protein [Candidatus Lernaella stagnicola]